MKRVGITGGIGSGKSTVCRILEVLRVPVFHADEEGRLLLNTDPMVRQAVTDAFGADLYSSGDLDRKVLAEVVFKDHEALARLNAIVHPAVRQRFNAWCAGQNGSPYVVMEAAVLAETGSASAMDHLVVVTAPEELRIRRVMERDGMGEEEVRARMKNQTDDASRNAKADTLISNDDHEPLIPQVLTLHHRLSGARSSDARRLPLSTVTLVFGAASLPLAFARQMVSLAVVTATLAIGFHLWGRWRSKKRSYSPESLKRSRLGWWCGLAGMACAMVMWVLWATNILLEK